MVGLACAIVCVMAIAWVVLIDVIVMSMLHMICYMVYIFMSVDWVDFVDSVLGWVVNVVVNWNFLSVVNMGNCIMSVLWVMDGVCWSTVSSAVSVMNNWNPMSCSMCDSVSSSNK